MKKIFAAMAVLAAMALAMPVMAADAPGYSVTMGGRVKVDMGWQLKSDDTIAQNGTADSSITNFFAVVNNNSYLRGTFTSADKTTGAVIEMGLGAWTNLNNSGGAQSNGMNTRQIYGWWKVGSCKMLVGQWAGRLGDGVIAGQALGTVKSAKIDLNGFGFIGGTRNPKVGLQMDVNDNFGFDVAIGQAGAETATFDNPATGGYTISDNPVGVDSLGNPVYAVTPATASGANNSYLPRLEVVLDFKFGNFKIFPGAGISYQEFKYDTYEEDDSTLSYLLWLPAKYENGPFYIAGNAFYAQNRDTDWTAENTATSITDRMYAYGGQRMALPVRTGKGEIEDTKSWGIGLTAGYSFTDQLTLRAGGGFENLSNDAWATADQDRDDYTRWGAFIAMPYKLTSNFTIQPEVNYWNYGDRVGIDYNADKEEAGDEWLLGVHFQFLF